MASSGADNAIDWRELGNGVFVTTFKTQSPAKNIYLKHIKAQKTSKNPVTIFLFHDLCSYHGRFTTLTEWFRVQYPEINFMLMDFSGHGLSSGTRAHLEGFYELADDIAFILKTLEKGPTEKWITLGHGMGALSLLDLSNRFDDLVKRKIDRLILSNFILQFSSPALTIQKKISEKNILLKDLMKVMRPIEIYLAGEILSQPRDQAQYLKDPLVVRKPTFQTLLSIEQRVKTIFQDAYFLEKPTLVLQSESRYIESGSINSFCKGFKKGLLVEKKYSNLKHDLYNERDNLNVFNDIAEWIQS